MKALHSSFGKHDEETARFVSALSSFISTALRVGEDADYSQKAIQIVDARNLMFRQLASHPTDEEHDIYALRSLCRLDEETFEFVPDEGRLRSIARNYF